MKYNKLGLNILLVFIVLILFTSVVSAEDNLVGADDGILAVENNDEGLMVENNDVAVVDDGDIATDVKLGVSNSDEILQADPAPGSYQDLQDLIDANYGGSIDLDRDYAHKNSKDLSQITISDKITINGNNHNLI